MGLTSAQLDVIDLTPRIGSEIRTDLDTLLSGREAGTFGPRWNSAASSSSAVWTSTTSSRSRSPRRSAPYPKTRARAAFTRSRSTRT